MARKTYRQYCTVAHALDLVGDRWTLLILRDLLPGPLRYSDLRAKQPRISTDILADRLGHLQAIGLIRRRELPPPAASSVYELVDEDGRVRSLLNSLVAFGRHYMPDPRTTRERMDPAWAMMTFAALVGANAPSGNGLELVWDAGRARLRSDGHAATVTYEHHEPADCTMRGASRKLLAVLTGAVAPEDSEVAITGDAAKLKAWIKVIDDAGGLGGRSVGD